MHSSPNRLGGAVLGLGLAVLLTGVAAGAGLILADGDAPDEAIAAALLQDASEQLVVASAE